MPQLSGCLALVRPVSMTDDAAADWLAIAASELAGYSRLLVQAGMEDARRRCTFHGQIVPHVIRFMEEATPWRMGKPLHREVAPVQRLEASPATPLIEQAAKALRA